MYIVHIYILYICIHIYLHTNQVLRVPSINGLHAHSCRLQKVEFYFTTECHTPRAPVTNIHTRTHTHACTRSHTHAHARTRTHFLLQKNPTYRGLLIQTYNYTRTYAHAHAPTHARTHAHALTHRRLLWQARTHTHIVLQKISTQRGLFCQTSPGVGTKKRIVSLRGFFGNTNR